MISVLYFHGFASSPESAKISALRPMLAVQGIELNAPDLNVPSFERLDFQAMVDHAVEAGGRTPPRALVGSSLGALIALAVARRGLAAPLVLIAPALGVADRWEAKIPETDPVVVFHYARNADVPIHRAFFEQMASLHIDDDPPPTRVTAIMGRDDEAVPFAQVAETWRRWEASGKLVPDSRFVELPEGDHSLLSHTDVLCNAIVDAVRRSG